MSETRTITPGELAAVLGAPRSTFYEALARGDIPEPSDHTLGGHRRWSVAEACAIVAARGKPIPDAWRAPIVRLALEVAAVFEGMENPAVQALGRDVRVSAEIGERGAHAALSGLDIDDVARLPADLVARVLEVRRT